MKVLLELEVDVTKEEICEQSNMLTFISSLQNAMSSEIEISGIEGKIPVFVMNVHLLNAGL